jgi:MFS family permease
VVGGIISEKKGWRWTQWTIVFCNVFVLLLTLGLSETYTKAIQKKRSGKKGQKAPVGPLLKQLVSVTVLTPVKMLMVEPIVALLSLYVAFNFAILFTFFGAFPYVFVGTYHFTIAQSGLVFIGIGVGCSKETHIQYFFKRPIF